MARKKRDRRRFNDSTRATEARRVKQTERATASASGQLALMDHKGRCRWHTFCRHAPVAGRFEGAFCALHEQAAAYELDLIDEAPEAAGWLAMSTDALALIEQFELRQEEA